MVRYKYVSPCGRDKMAWIECLLFSVGLNRRVFLERGGLPFHYDIMMGSVGLDRVPVRLAGHAIYIISFHFSQSFVCFPRAFADMCNVDCLGWEFMK